MQCWFASNRFFFNAQNLKYRAQTRYFSLCRSRPYEATTTQTASPPHLYGKWLFDEIRSAFAICSTFQRNGRWKKALFTVGPGFKVYISRLNNQPTDRKKLEITGNNQNKTFNLIRECSIRKFYFKNSTF